MNIQGLLIAALLWTASVVGAFFYGTGVGADGEIAKQTAVEKSIKDTREAAQLGAADAIAKIKIYHKTVQGKLETVVRENPVYVDCKHTDDGMRLINQALTGSRSGSTGGGNVSGADPSAR